MAFGLDAAGAVHWFYPAYLKASADPEAVPIPAGTRHRTLSEVVEPVRVAPGPFRVVTLLFKNAPRVKQIEHRLKGYTAPHNVARLFPTAVMRQWLVTMEAN